MRRRIMKGSAWLLSLLLVGLALTGCSAVRTGKEGNKSETDQIVEVNLKIPARRIVAIGPGALRLVAYMGQWTMNGIKLCGLK